MSHSPIDFKGSNFTFLVLYLYDSDHAIIRKAIQKKVDNAPTFLRHAPIIVNVSMLSSKVNWNHIQHAILETGLSIVGVSGCRDEKLKQVIMNSGLAILNEGAIDNSYSNIYISKSIPDQIKGKSKTRLISSPVRSGQQIYAKNTDLVIINSVSEGAELIADGNIHVYGSMRGRALAGVDGDESCQIFCTHLLAELLSIAGQYWMMEQIPSNCLGKTSRLYLESGVLTLQNLI
ncbi:septum site-determining protein MinC [Candidatus Erwinia haradaeae]|uniref:Probable septum site-determining protein MinC n=1 Tax=Candidatus Erwinia haradaeae TaxID=1922217 RepID=A0A451D8A1_9GAMM|nr:septum site-determining protein MinC [Candidatus Erwinia haradaeae]VFP81995.1 Septum site-determining protein MinC [Candidatus Erwinia haradaeae]